jgi:dTDP-4-amino-4,6-dideoxygalactose transaminase
MSDTAANSVRDVLECGFIAQGPKVDAFEDMLQKELDTHTKPVVVNSCTSSIDLALELCDVGPDD